MFPDEESYLPLVIERTNAQEQACSQRRYLNMDLLNELDLEVAKEGRRQSADCRERSRWQLHSPLDTIYVPFQHVCATYLLPRAPAVKFRKDPRTP